MKKHIRESNLIEGFDNPEFDKKALEVWNFLNAQQKLTHTTVMTVQNGLTQLQPELKPTQRGLYRTLPVWVGHWLAPQPTEVGKLMSEWLATFMQMTPKRAHIAFEKIHPFIDGNGRTGRMLMWWHELKIGKKPTLILSSQKEKYYKWFSEDGDGSQSR